MNQNYILNNRESDMTERHQVTYQIFLIKHAVQEVGSFETHGYCIYIENIKKIQTVHQKNKQIYIVKEASLLTSLYI
jgi:hypothetical protein